MWGKWWGDRLGPHRAGLIRLAFSCRTKTCVDTTTAPVGDAGQSHQLPHMSQSVGPVDQGLGLPDLFSGDERP